MEKKDAPTTGPSMEGSAKLGRDILYRKGDVLLAGKIVKVWNDDGVNLVFWTENGEQGRETSVLRGEQDGQWRWPPR